MSDFFGDDFTAELKEFFLNQFISDIAKYIDAIDEDSWFIFREEIREKSKDWIVDANTNEFTFFANWFSELVEANEKIESAVNFKSSLQQVESYLQKLLATKKDTAELPQQFAVVFDDNKSGLYLHCQIQGQEIVLPAMNVIEVVGSKSFAALPTPVEGLCGMMAYRGEAIPVFSMPEIGMKTESQKYYYVVCEVSKQLFALQTTHVDQLIEVNSRDLQSKESAASIFPADFISHFVRIDNKNMVVFDLNKLVAA